MNRIDKKKFNEIAEELEFSAKTDEKRMSAALKALKENVQKFKKFKI